MGLRKTLYGALERFDQQLNERVSNLPSLIRAFLFFILGGLADREDWKNNSVTTCLLLGFGIFISFGLLVFSSTNKPKPPKGRM